ncbi:MAG: GIY-YIG nuclease family protein [Planctomycetales bacterium]|nr:GIY-YIG nuclease family protein [Planctomycetales bacterium]
MSECGSSALSESPPAGNARGRGGESKGYGVYIRQLGDGRLYVGHTRDLAVRNEHHAQRIGGRTTRIFGAGRLLYVELHPDRISAVRRERQLKGWSRAKKLALASGDVEQLKALARRRRR